MLCVPWELQLHICMTLVHNTGGGSVAFFLPSARARLILMSRKDRRLSSRGDQAVQHSLPWAAVKGFHLKIPSLYDSLYLLRVVSVAGAGRCRTAHHQQLCKEIFYFHHFCKCASCREGSFKPFSQCTTAVRNALADSIMQNIFEKILFPFKLKAVKELSTRSVTSIEAGSEFLRK